MNIVGLAANLHLRHTGNHLGYSHGDIEMIGPGIAFEKHVRTSDMGVRRLHQNQGQEEREKEIHGDLTTQLKT
jgi:hypothetical protein